jgi:hypothetical protein
VALEDLDFLWNMTEPPAVTSDVGHGFWPILVLLPEMEGGCLRSSIAIQPGEWGPQHAVAMEVTSSVSVWESGVPGSTGSAHM